MRVEAFARYKRLKGFNVLFPQGWHATGSPIVAAAQRVKENEPKQIELLKKEGFSDKEIKKFSEPKHWIDVFGKIWLEDYKSMGIGVDWRRNFITTLLNTPYDKFIQWQFRKLKEKGYIEKGEHPVVWDTKTNMPVGDHDRIEGEGEVPQEFLLVKHKLGDRKFIISATLRQDTILGITNLYVNPNIEYLEIKINNEKWILGEEAVKRLQEQDRELKIIGKIKGTDLIGKKTEEVDGHKVLILPATFLDSKFGTGLVHSVPSDSADDLIALWDLQKDKVTIKKYNLNVEEIKRIKPLPVLDTPSYGSIPAEVMLKKYNVKSQSERTKLEKIKKELYKLSFHTATFNKKYKDFFSKNLYGKKVSEGKDLIKKSLLERGWIDVYYQLTGKVISRSLTECIVKIVSDQWFIKYGDKKWKKQVHNVLKETKLYPENTREQFEYVIDWLNDWACTREYGLGTKLPFDEKWVIESLSDSTIYMAYYTFAHLIKKLKIKDVNDELFDYILLNKGKGKKEWKKLKEEFEYWYPLDFRNSGKDLVQNHLTFFLFNHVAIFHRKYWPKSIGVNGWVKVDNQKMSKSLGNVIPLREMYKKFGADVSRLTILNGGEKSEDPNWDSNFADSLSSKFENMGKIILDNYGKGRNDIKNVDKWMQSFMNKLILDATNFMEETLFRSAIQKIFFDFGNLIKRYLSKTENNPNKSIFEQAIKSYLIMLSPFCPHICEEMWKKIGKKEFISLEGWPKYDKNKINEDLERQDELIEKISEDINHVVKLINEKEIKKAIVYILPNEKKIYVENIDLIKRKTNLNIEIYAVNDKNKYDPQNKSKKVKPGRPGIYLE